VCGGAIIQYDHFEPEFADAHAHKSEGIILLCGGCHNLKTVGRLSKETLAKHAADPKCRQTGFSFGPFDIGTTPPKVSIGEITAENVDVLLRIHGEDIFGISAPSTLGEPFLIDAAFRDANGNPTLEIVRNEWRSNAGNWDVEVKGQLITIRQAHAHLVLQIRTVPPHALVVERLLMFHKGWLISAGVGRTTTFKSDSGRVVTARAAQLGNWNCAITLGERGALSLGQGGKADSYIDVGYFAVD